MFRSIFGLFSGDGRAQNTPFVYAVTVKEIARRAPRRTSCVYIHHRGVGACDGGADEEMEGGEGRAIAISPVAFNCARPRARLCSSYTRTRSNRHDFLIGARLLSFACVRVTRTRARERLNLISRVV